MFFINVKKTINRRKCTNFTKKGEIIKLFQSKRQTSKSRKWRLKTGAPHQGIRCYFSFFGEPENKMYMIWPEFENNQGKVVMYNNRPVPNEREFVLSRPGSH